METIPPSRKIGQELKGVLEKEVTEGDLLSEFLQKGMQLVMQELLKAEVVEFLEKER